MSPWSRRFWVNERRGVVHWQGGCHRVRLRFSSVLPTFQYSISPFARPCPSEGRPLPAIPYETDPLPVNASKDCRLSVIGPSQISLARRSRATSGTVKVFTVPVLTDVSDCCSSSFQAATSVPRYRFINRDQVTVSRRGPCQTSRYAYRYRVRRKLPTLD